MHKSKEAELQASHGALLRSVIQSTGSTLLWVLILLVLGGLYLSVSAKAANAGRQVMSLNNLVDQQKQVRSEVTARHAIATSPDRMRELASSMGFRPAELKDVRFIHTPWKPVETPFQAPIPRSVEELRKTMLSPAYTETLVEALKRMFGVGGLE
jgi:hypothetical protein